MPPRNLPEPVSELVGRDDELRETLNLAAAHRLVTLTGAGGIGKTRLALAVARERLPELADGVCLAELAPLADPAFVPAAVASALGLEFPASAVSAERVANALSGKDLLLVLDNCEHVIDSGCLSGYERWLRFGGVTWILPCRLACYPASRQKRSEFA